MKTKFCPKCNSDKELELFNTNKARKDGHQGVCKKCQAEYTKSHYNRTKDIYANRARQRAKEIRKWIAEYKQGRCCKYCGENHPACLQFHHVDKRSKEITIANVASNGWTIERLKEEINKCILLCANCHCKEHYEQKYTAAPG